MFKRGSGAVNMRRMVAVVLATVALEANAQESQEATELKVAQLVEKKSEYHRLTNGEQNGYRIKIHFGDRESAKTESAKFVTAFPDVKSYEEYQQPYFVVLVGDYRTKLEAYKALKKFKSEFPNAFIVKGKIKL